MLPQLLNYTLPQDGHIKLEIYNTLGVEISEVENGFKKAGIYSYNFDASKYASGVYYSVLKFEDNIQTKKMLLLK